MPLGETTSFVDIKEGARVAVEVANATYDEGGRFGPEMQFELEALKPDVYAGGTILSSLSLSQPRLNKVRNLRADGISDEAIAESLREKGFEFEKIDDWEEPRIGGTLRKIIRACLKDDTRAYRKLMNECDSFDELADALIGKRFTTQIRHDKNGYSRIDGKADFYPYVETSPANGNLGGHTADIVEEDAQDFDDIPF